MVTIRNFPFAVQAIPDNDYDPFGVHHALQQALRDQPWWSVVGAKLINWTILLVALLPLPLVLLSGILLLIVGVPVWVKWSAGIFSLWFGLFLVDQFRLFGRQPVSQALGRRGSVIVIGAGPVGLAVVKECLTQGLDVKCFERQNDLGGVYRPNRDFLGGCWPTVKLTSSPWVTAYSDFPPKSSSCQHQTAQEYLEYLEDYVEHFGFRNCLHFRQTVISVEPDNGGWCVITVDRDTSKTTRHWCDRVAICVGLNLNPKSINLPGLNTFNGQVCHSASYFGTEELKDKCVVVSGAGESGVDIAAEVSQVARETYLSLRKGKFIIPRINPLNGMPNDYDTNRIRNASPIVLQNWFMSFRRGLCFYSGEHQPETAFRAQLLKQSSVGPVSQTATKSDDFIYRVMEDKLKLRTNIVSLDRDDVIFEDGLRHPADVVIFAHGYTPSFPFLKYPEGVQALHPSELYLNMFHPELGDSLAFCGFARPTIGAIPPIGELQARLFALLASGKLGLPEPRVMACDIVQAKQENAENFPTQSQPNVLVRWIPYMDKLASLIGCRPTAQYLLTRPGLLWKLCAGPMTGAQYRLQGPGASQTSWETVMKLPRMHQLSEILTYIGLHFWIWPIQGLIRNTTWRSSNTIT
ncbi:MAG: NAD(P)-binding domain-containing protein [Symploca sp. SIO2D2]|nr:NAD(P)-binding domain-containing protein [Symploca sp. SIO2D2]